MNRRAMMALALPAITAAFVSHAANPPQAVVRKYDVEIRRTSFGIPHIKAADEGSLGYGIGYAYAEDNPCLLAEQIVTANGERSKYFGAEGKFRERVGNLQSDTLHRWLDRDGRTQAAWNAQPADVRSLLRGYAAGVNRYLADTPAAGLPAACAAAPWLRPVTELDLIRLSRFYTVALGLGGFAEAFGTARPAMDAAAPRAEPHARIRFEQDRMGSNAVAIGRDLSSSGGGMLLGNPHLEWDGPFRFWQLHATIPGKLDVMGASLPGHPGVQIGFNRHVAWSHTVDTSSHYVLYRLTLDPADPTRYLVDGKSEGMKQVDVYVDVRKSDASVIRKKQTVYETRFGPVLAWQGWLLWNREIAYSLHDPNADNDRALAQWLRMGEAQDLPAFRRAIESTLGIPWVNTIAVDAEGIAAYLNVSVIPYVDAQRTVACAVDRKGAESDEKVFMLDGSRAACLPASDASTPQPGIFPPSKLPQLDRSDFVQNSNDSAWFTNPARPLTGYPPVVSQQDIALGGRTRYALDRLTADSRAGRRIDRSRLQGMMMDNEVYFARVVLDDAIRLCARLHEVTAGDGARIDVAKGCAALGEWDRTVNLEAGRGYLYFSAFMENIRTLPAIWAVPFDAGDPIHTPRGLRLGVEEVEAQLRAALAQAVKEVDSRGYPLAARWGDIQVTEQRGEKIPLHGGDQALGIYNHMGSAPMDGGLLRVTDGATYVQAVMFGPEGPSAEGYLVYSQSSNPQSPHATDQTWRFSRKQWIVFPFTEAQIAADPEYTTRRLRQ